MQNRRSFYKYEDVITYLNAEVRALFEVEIELDSTKREPITEKIDGIDIPIIEKLIIPEEERLISMGFPCVQSRNLALLPVVSAFLQYSLVQRSNQQLSVPYSQITQSYHDAILFLENNKDLCNRGKNSVRSQIKSSSRRNVNAGF